MTDIRDATFSARAFEGFYNSAYARGFADGMERAARIVEETTIKAPRSIGRDKGAHHQAGAQHMQRVVLQRLREPTSE